jgi:hypothetical protein
MTSAAQTMFGTLLRQVELRHLTSFASPAFFDVFPRRALWSQGMAVLANQRNKQGFERCRAERQRALDRAGLRVRVWPSPLADERELHVPDSIRSAYAHSVLTLYFHQIFAGSSLLLDLSARAVRPARDHVRVSRVEARDAALVTEPSVALDWRPSAWYVDLTPEFRDGLQLLYRGFYLADDASFDAGAAQLGLTPLRHLFREHFGERVTDMRFELKHFLDSFQRIFRFCKTHGIELRSDFVLLGACLSTLYENLERLDVRVDARHCFIEASRVSTGESQRAAGEGGS